MELKHTHICFEVSQFDNALKFWDPLLTSAGFALAWGDKKTYCGFRNGTVTVVIAESRPRRVTRASPTGSEVAVADHVGFAVGSRADVDAVALAMAKAGFKPLFPAQVYSEFGPDFYAVTLCDSDNNVIEFGHSSFSIGSPAS